MTLQASAQAPLALVIGATGGFGGETAQALLVHGWRVRALQRNPEAAQASTGLPLQWVKGDAMVEGDVIRAAEGAKVIVHAANPPGYKNWAGTVLPMIEASIAAARYQGARILVPGNVYNYGPDAFPVLHVGSPQNPLTRKGAIRVEMERRLREAAADGAKSVILRAGDFFGPRVTGNSWISQMVRPGKPVKSLVYPGPLTVRRAWAYLPDMAEAACRLLAQEDELAAFASYHFAGHALTGRAMAQGFEAAVGRKLPVRPFPWPAVYAMAAFNETLREVLEMRYLWKTEVVLDGDRLADRIGPVPHTPIETALVETLAALGCLPAKTEALAA
jgi:nucleoside-diphosphate-sugar epimerase